MLQMRSGRVVLTSQYVVYDPGHHVTVTHYSDDQGRSWRRSNTIDLGGHGHHDGAIEATVAELRDGRLWMLMRTNRDRIWRSFGKATEEELWPGTLTGGFGLDGIARRTRTATLLMF